jgi:hypothetical protein
MKTIALSALNNLLTKLADPEITGDEAQKLASALGNVHFVANNLVGFTPAAECAAPAETPSAPAAAKPKGPGRPPKAAPAATPSPTPSPELANENPVADEPAAEEEMDLMGDSEPEVTAHTLKAFLGAGILRSEAENKPRTTFVVPAGKIMKEMGGGASNVATIKPELYKDVYAALLKMEYIPTPEQVAAYSAELKAKGQ